MGADSVRITDSLGAEYRPVTIETLNKLLDEVSSPIEVVVPPGSASALRLRIDAEFDEAGRARITVREHDQVKSGVVYIYGITVAPDITEFLVTDL